MYNTYLTTIHAGICLLYIYSKFLISIHSQNGGTPLLIASFNGCVDIVRLLVEAKAQLNVQEEV